VLRAQTATFEAKKREWRNARVTVLPAARESGRRFDRRRVSRERELTLAALFGVALGKDVVRDLWRRARGDWDARSNRSPEGAVKAVRADFARHSVVPDKIVVCTRFDKKATMTSPLVAFGTRGDG